MKSEGVCKFCNKTFSGSGMTKHLQSCPERKKAQSSQGKGEIFLIKAYSDPFWVYFEVNASDTLYEIDNFLRDLWLECCGHLSAFEIDSIDYCSDSDDMSGDNDMDIPLEDVLRPGTEFSHEYDFGTTTELDLKCISERQGKLKEIQILARNNMPEFLCSECGKPAVHVCSQCIWEGEGFLCESCAKDHECGEEMLLPVVNSPRMGMCAYTG